MTERRAHPDAASGHGVAIRRMQPTDYDAVRQLWQVAELAIRPAGRDARRPVLEQLRLFPTTYLVAETAGRIVGVVFGTHDGRKGWINRLAVHPDYRRRGIARRLLDACEHALHAAGIDIIAALVEVGNDTSAATFRAAGYQSDVPVIYFRKLRRPDI